LIFSGLGNGDKNKILEFCVSAEVENGLLDADGLQ
jgi:hypothetical protein